jgi:hypothetical protein
LPSVILGYLGNSLSHLVVTTGRIEEYGLGERCVVGRDGQNDYHDTGVGNHRTNRGYQKSSTLSPNPVHSDLETCTYPLRDRRCPLFRCPKMQILLKSPLPGN